MNALQYLSAFRVYGADVLALALGVTLLTSLLKKTVMKNCPKKVYVFLPFALGLVFYAVFRAILTRSATPFTTEIAKTLEGGFACGCAATLYYVVYEQFFREKEPLLPVSALLTGFVPNKNVKKAAEELMVAAEGKQREELYPLVRDVLLHYVEPSLPEPELELLSQTVAAFLSETAI